MRKIEENNMRKIQVATSLKKMVLERDRLQKIVEGCTPDDIVDADLDVEAVLKKIDSLNLTILMHRALSEPINA